MIIEKEKEKDMRIESALDRLYKLKWLTLEAETGRGTGTGVYDNGQ